MKNNSNRQGERGAILLVVMFIATAIAVLATISSGRVVMEHRHQRVLENETRALGLAFANLHLGMSVVNNSAYDNQNHNLALQYAIAGQYGGTAAGQTYTGPDWLADPSGVVHGFLQGTEVRVYRARDYIKRLQQIKGDTVSASIDPANLSQAYFVLEAAGRAGDTIRVVSALVRENEPFSSFVFFQNQHPLGVSGSPSGLIHSNDKVAFYFPDGDYQDPVSAVHGFDFLAGATQANTNLPEGNPTAPPISLEAVDFAELRTKANLFAGTPGLDAEIRLFAGGTATISQYTKPRFDWVTNTKTRQVLTGYTPRTVTNTRQVQVGITTETRTRQILTGYTTETYTVTVPVYETQQVQATRQVAVWGPALVTKTRWVQVFVPYTTGDGAGGGTAVGGGGSGVTGEYVWVQETYQVTEQVITGYITETYTTTQQVQVGTTTETRTRQVPIYATETYTVDVPVYQTETYETTVQDPVYATETYTETVWTFFPPVFVDSTTVNTKAGGTVFVDGRITRLSGDLNGHLTIVGNEKVRVTGNIRYVDDAGRTAMLNGSDYTKPYTRNTAYSGTSVLGVLARGDVVLTRDMPTKAEINATLMSVTGRVGIDGFAIGIDGTPIKSYQTGMTDQQKAVENAYDQVSAYRTRTYTKDSLRRIGGLISNSRILETYILPRSDGTSYVDAGFKRGNMKFDINLLFNPPPNFVEVPRPVLTYYAPVFFVRNNEG